MEIDRETLQYLAAKSLILSDDAYGKESTLPCYSLELDGSERAPIDFQHGSIVFFSGKEQAVVNEMLRDVLSFMDGRKDFEVYLAGNPDHQEQCARVISQEDLSLLLVYLEEKLKQRKAIIEGVGAKKIEEYNEKPGQFLPYLALVIDKADEAEKDPTDPFSKLIPLLYEYADHGFRVIAASTKILSTRNGRILQGDLSFEEANNADISFIVSHGYDVIDLGGRPRTIASDPLYKKAVEYTLQEKTITTAMLQRKLRIGYSKAIRFIKEMRRTGVLPRMTCQDYQKKEK